MKVFITGASGYVGFNVASAFRRAGHQVLGLVRNEAGAASLAGNEIRPVMGDMEKPESYRAAAEESTVLVHTASDLRGDTVDLDKKTVETLIATGKKGPQPKTFIFTSGAWVYGDTGGKLVDETCPLRPAKLVAWRPGHEAMVLNAAGVRGLVVRPGCAYGRQGKLTNMWFEGAYREKALRIVGEGNNRWTMVHVDDLADGYVRVAESGLSGEIFNLNDCSRWTVKEMANAAACAAGYSGEIRSVPLDEASRIMGDFASCLALDQYVDSSKAMHLLGWQPGHKGFVDEIVTYFESWKEHQR